MSKDQKIMNRKDMLVAIGEFKMRMGREVNVSDFPPHLREQMARLFGSPDKALDIASRANITQAQIQAFREQFAAELEKYVIWNAAGAIGMPNDLRLKECGGSPPILNSQHMPDANQRREFQEIAQKAGIGRKLVTR